MNILFLTLDDTPTIEERGVYNDLMRKFANEGHKVWIVSPLERRFRESTKLLQTRNINRLKIKTLNIQKTNLIEKAIATFLIQYQFLKGIKKYFNNVNFDLVIYSTPPITFTKIIKSIKNKYRAKSYLLLKDIFPQNAVDLGILKRNGILHKYFRRKEKQLYKISDYIGCLSPANVAYILKWNPWLQNKIVEVNPDSIEPIDINTSKSEIQSIREKLGIPANATIFLYGGNLGLPQGIDFLLEVLNSQKNNERVFFIIVGSGTMFSKLETWFNENNPMNAKLLSAMPKHDYDNFIHCCDVGLIFLDKRFTIPNYPLRLLSYLEIKKPVLLATDKNTDIGRIAEENNYGYWVESGDLKSMIEKINILEKDIGLRKLMGLNGYYFLLNNYTVAISYSIIMKHFQKN